MSFSQSGFPCTLENLEKLENGKLINFQAWKSPGKKKKLECCGKSWKFLKNTYEIRIECFCYDLYSPLTNKITVLENLNFDLEKSWKNVSKSKLVQLQI